MCESGLSSSDLKWVAGKSSLPMFLMISILTGFMLIIIGVTGMHSWLIRKEKAIDPEGYLIESIDDPREAAAILLMRMAMEKGEVTPSVKVLITQMLQSRFDYHIDEMDGLLDFAEAAAFRMGGLDVSLRRVLAPVKTLCTSEQWDDLLGMMGVIADQEGGRTVDQQAMLTRTKQLLDQD